MLFTNQDWYGINCRFWPFEVVFFLEHDKFSMFRSSEKFRKVNFIKFCQGVISFATSTQLLYEVMPQMTTLR